MTNVTPSPSPHGPPALREPRNKQTQQPRKQTEQQPRGWATGGVGGGANNKNVGGAGKASPSGAGEAVLLAGRVAVPVMPPLPVSAVVPIGCATPWLGRR